MANNNNKNNKPAAAPEKAAEKELVKPRVDGFKLFGKRTAGVQDIVEALAPLSFLEMASEGDYLAVLNVESRDIRRNPYLFSTIYLKPDVIEVVYTTVPGTTSPKKRRIDVLRHVLNVLSLLSDSYQLDNKYLFQVLQKSLEDLTEFVSSDYKEVYGKYDSLKTDYKEVQRQVEKMKEENEKFGKQLVEANAKSDQLALRLSQLESYSDPTVMAKIQDWLDVHRNEINITEFAKQNNINETRVEEVLNKMVTQGYLELRG